MMPGQSGQANRLRRGPEQTVVELEHRHLDRLAGGDAIRGMIVSSGGWTAILELFAKAVQ